MKFNPLFLPGNNSVAGSGSSKQSKLNSPSYLFSDIIRLLNDSQPGQKTPLQEENANSDGNSLFFASKTIKNLLAVNDAEITSLVNNGAAGLKQVKDNPAGENAMSIDANGQINIPASDSGLEVFLQNLLNSLPGDGIKLKEVNGNGINAGDNLSVGSKLRRNLIDLLKNKDTLTLNIDLLNNSALNFNDKQQLVSKVFNTAENEGNPNLPANGEKNSLNHELEKIASLLFGLLSGQNSLTQTGVAEQTGKPNTSVEPVTPGGSEGAKKEIKDTILGLLKEDKPVTLNFNLGDEKLKLEITANAGETINNSIDGTQETGTVQQDISKSGDTIDAVSLVQAGSKNIAGDIPVNNLNNALNNPGPGNAVKTGEPVQGEKNVSTNETGTKNFNLKITSESGDNNTQNTAALKELLQKLGADKEEGMKIFTSGNKTVLKSQPQNQAKVVTGEKTSASGINNTLPPTPGAQTEIPAQQLPASETTQDTGKKVTESIAQAVGDANKKQADGNKTIDKSGEVSANKSTESAGGKIVAGLNESAEKNTSDESKDDKRFLFDAGTAQLQGKQGQVKNDLSKIFANTNAENSIPVKAENLMGEISRFMEQGESKSVVLKLKPDTLGKVKIVLDVVDKVVHANIQVENEAVKQVIQGNINTLRQTLNLSGLQLSGFNISLNSNESGEGKSYGNKKKSTHPGTGSKVPGEIELASIKSMGYNTYDFLA